MNLAQVEALIVNRQPFTYSIKFGDVSMIDGSIFTVYDWIPFHYGMTLKSVMGHYAELFTDQSAVIEGVLVDEGYYSVKIGHMRALDNIKIKIYDESKRA